MTLQMNGRNCAFAVAISPKNSCEKRLPIRFSKNTPGQRFSHSRWIEVSCCGAGIREILSLPKSNSAVALHICRSCLSWVSLLPNWIEYDLVVIEIPTALSNRSLHEGYQKLRPEIGLRSNRNQCSVYSELAAQDCVQ